MKKRIVFMGTPEFAVNSLAALNEHRDWELVAVITSTDKIGGRGKRKLIQSAVKQFALAHQLTVLQPKNLKSKTFVEKFRTLKPDLAVVVAFRMLPEVIWSMPKYGTINLHASLLPAYRGAAPINWAIINGEKMTGLTTFFIDKQIDTGQILLQHKINIEKNDTAGTLHDRMKELGASLVVRTATAIFSGSVIPKDQPILSTSKAPKIYHGDCEINVGSAETLYNFVRGLSPYPGAWIMIDEKECKIYSVDYHIIDHIYAPGTFVTDGKKFLKLATPDGWIEILELKMSGRKTMFTTTFLNGYDLKNSQSIVRLTP